MAQDVAFFTFARIYSPYVEVLRNLMLSGNKPPLQFMNTHSTLVYTHRIPLETDYLCCMTDAMALSVIELYRKVSLYSCVAKW